MPNIEDIIIAEVFLLPPPLSAWATRRLSQRLSVGHRKESSAASRFFDVSDS